MWAGDGESMWTTDATAMWAAEAAFQPWPGSLILKDAPYEVRISTGTGSTQGQVSVLTPTIDAPDIFEILEDVSIGAGGSRLSLTESFDTIKVVNMTLQDDGGDAESLVIVDKDASLGPLINARDADQALTAATIDARVQGY